MDHLPLDQLACLTVFNSNLPAHTLFPLRVIREETSPSISWSPIKVTFSSDLVPSGRVITPSNKIKEDPVEYESGSELVV